MCGIAGLVRHGGGSEHDAEIVRRMASSIARRGPDDNGEWAERSSGVALAHRRLSILDLSRAGHQPMVSQCGRWVLTFNGEIYNYREIQSELERGNAAPLWRGSSDTEVLLAAFAAWGIRRTLDRTVGMFALGLWDRSERRLTLARDRLGEKPLYFGWSGDDFVFGSELAVFVAYPGWRGEINRTALSLLLRHNYVPAPYTIYDGISKLSPGTYLTFSTAMRDVQIETYWDAAEVAAMGARKPFKGSAEDAADCTDALIRQSLKGQMIADVPVGAFFSGGVDSSTVVSLMQAMSSRPIRTFTIGFGEEAYNEAPHAKAVARHLGTNHNELYVTRKEAMSIVPNLASLYSEPFGDVSQIPTVLVSQLARQHVTVALSGDGGDELFSGYTRYRVADKLWSALSRIPRPLRAASSRFARSIPPVHYDRLLKLPLGLLPKRLRPALVGSKIHKAAGVAALKNQEEVYRALVSHWQRPENVVIGAAPAHSRTFNFGRAAIGGSVRKMMLMDQTTYLPDDILVKVDRASMGVGLETRVPLLDHRLVEFTWSLPMDLLRRNGQSKWPLRRVLDRYVPRKLIDRPKMGFGVPIDSWLRGDLRDWAESLLDARRLAHEGYFHPAPIRAAWDAHVQGRGNLQHQLWSVLMFQAWLEAHRLLTVTPARVPMRAK